MGPHLWFRSEFVELGIRRGGLDGNGQREIEVVSTRRKRIG